MATVEVLEENGDEFRVGDFVLYGRGSGSRCLATILELKPSKKHMWDNVTFRHEVIIRVGDSKKKVRTSSLNHISQDKELLRFTLNAVRNLKHMNSKELDTLGQMLNSNDSESVNLAFMMIQGDDLKK